MQKLPDKIKISGIGINITATLVERTTSKAIYLRSDNIYEIFKIKITPKNEVFGKTYPERESYPSNEDFGKIAWTFRTLKKAKELYDNLP